MANILFLMQLVGVGLILYSGTLLLQHHIRELRCAGCWKPLDRCVCGGLTRHERRQAWADKAPRLDRLEWLDSPPLRLGRAAADRWAEVVSNGMLDELWNPASLEEQLAA